MFPLILNAQQRWFYLIDAYLILLTIGASTQFPLYSNKVKTILNLSQSSLTTIASLKNLGATMGFLSGPLFGVFPTWLVIELSALFNFTDHLFIHLVVSQSIFTPKIWKVYLAALGGLCKSFYLQLQQLYNITFRKINPYWKATIETKALRTYCSVSSAILTRTCTDALIICAC